MIAREFEGFLVVAEGPKAVVRREQCKRRTELGCCVPALFQRLQHMQQKEEMNTKALVLGFAKLKCTSKKAGPHGESRE